MIRSRHVVVTLFMLSLLATVQCFAALSYGTQNCNDYGTNPSCTLSGSVSVGQAIVVLISSSASFAAPTVSDNLDAGNYIELEGTDAEGLSTYLYYKVVTTAGTPVISASTPSDAEIVANYVSGFLGTPTADSTVAATNSSAGSSTMTINAASNFNNEVLLISLETSASGMSGASGWTYWVGCSDFSCVGWYAIEDAPTSNNFSLTLDGDGTWVVAVAGIYDAGVAGPSILIDPNGHPIVDPTGHPIVIGQLTEPFSPICGVSPPAWARTLARLPWRQPAT